MTAKSVTIVTPNQEQAIRENDQNTKYLKTIFHSSVKKIILNEIKMLQLFIITLLLAACTAEHYQFPLNVSRSTVSGIAAYRSALTLDWLAGEDSRQRELALAFETESTSARPRARVNDCSGYSRPAAGKVARLMLELLKNLEGDEGAVIPELIKALVLSKLLVETSVLESEPDFEALVQTPGAMMGEPHATFPRIMALSWLLTTDPVTTKRNGWCPVTQLTQYLRLARPSEIAKHMRGLDPIIARARFIMEDFIQNVTPLMYPETTASTKIKRRKSDSERRANAQLDVFPTPSEKPSPSPPPAELFLNPSPIDHPMDRFDNSAGPTHGLSWTIPWLLPLSVLVM